jgi:hypothetical protein
MSHARRTTGGGVRSGTREISRRSRGGSGRACAISPSPAQAELAVRDSPKMCLDCRRTRSRTDPISQRTGFQPRIAYYRGSPTAWRSRSIHARDNGVPGGRRASKRAIAGFNHGFWICALREQQPQAPGIAGVRCCDDESGTSRFGADGHLASWSSSSFTFAGSPAAHMSAVAPRRFCPL